jgi:malonyl CoA-acyl carrier protein transacylase
MPPVTSTTAVLFPGQGCSTDETAPLVALHAPDLLDHAIELLGEDPFERAGESTRFAQPAIFCASLAGWRSLEQAEAPLAFAGHSLGELSALAAAGAIEPHTALELVVLRAALMDEAGQASPGGGMLALLKADIATAYELADRHGVVIANDNAPGQAVLSGDSDRLRELATEAREAGLRAIVLGVSGAFHSPAMRPAREPFAQALAEAEIWAPSVPVFSGLTARPFEDIRRELVESLTRPVRWRETIAALRSVGAVEFIDAGPDVVLERLVARNLVEVSA